MLSPVLLPALTSLVRPLGTLSFENHGIEAGDTSRAAADTETATDVHVDIGHTSQQPIPSRHPQPSSRATNGSVAIQSWIATSPTIGGLLALAKIFNKQALEHSLFVFADGTHEIVAGDQWQTSSVYHCGARGEGLFVAHTHAGRADFSIADAQILTARAMLNVGTNVEHTVFGKDDGGGLEENSVSLLMVGGSFFVEAEDVETKAFFHEVYAALVGLTPDELMRFANQPAQLGLDLPASLKGISDREKFLSALSRLDLITELAELDVVKGLKTGEEIALTLSGELSSRIRYLTLIPGGERKGGMTYFHISLEVKRKRDGLEVVVRNVDGMNVRTIARALATNPHIVVPSWFYTFAKVQAVWPLLIRLSEFGRGEILRKMRELGFGVEDGTVVADEAGLRAAGRGLLLTYAADYVSHKDRWQTSDPRWGVARTLGQYLSAERFEPEQAKRVSDLLQAALLVSREHELADYRRVLRLEGESPIAESGWESLFSPTLTAYLRATAVAHFDTFTQDTAHEILRNPYNEVVGFAFHLLTLENRLDLAHEILLHLLYQHRRDNPLTQVVDGLVRASGLSRPWALEHLRQEMHGVEALLNAWDMDVENPFRLVEGITAAAATFTWSVFSEEQQGEVRNIVQGLFPQHAHEFTAETNLSLALPQCLYFEAVGVAAHAANNRWQGEQSVRNATLALDFFLGLGADTVMGFRRGYNGQDPRRDFALIMAWVTNLKGEDRDSVLRFMEEGFVYRRNVVHGGEYREETVTVRRGDVLEGLLTGLTLREQTGALRLFRTGRLEAAEELRRLTAAHEKLTRHEALTEGECAWLHNLLALYTQPPQGKPKAEELRRWLRPPPGSRWHDVWAWDQEHKGLATILEAVLSS